MNRRCSSTGWVFAYHAEVSEFKPGIQDISFFYTLLNASSNMFSENANYFAKMLLFVAVFLGCTSTGRVGLCF